MKRRNRILAIALASTLALSLTACGNSTGSSASNQAPAEAEDTAAPADDAAAASAEPEALSSEPETAPTESSEEDTAEESSDQDIVLNEKTNEEFTIGTCDGFVYNNTFFNIKLDGDANGMTLIPMEDMTLMNGGLVDSMDDETVKTFIAAPSSPGIMVMYAQNEDNTRRISLTVKDFQAQFVTLAELDTLLDQVEADMPASLEEIGMTDVNLTREPYPFLGTTYPCLTLTGDLDGPFYERIIYVPAGTYAGIVAVYAESDEACCELLDLLQTAE